MAGVPMTSVRRAFRQRLAAGGAIIAPSVPDPLSARLAERAGFDAIALGGYALGAHLLCTEPLISLEELAAATRRITRYARIPLIVDGGAGYGEAMHTMHTIRELELAGAAAVHIEDQYFPKRAHYHRGIEAVVPLGEMLTKIRAAAAARTDPDFVIIARTDSMRTHGYEEGIRRARAFAEAGADLVMVFANDRDEAARAPRDAGVPLVHTNSQGGRFGRPVLSRAELNEFGYAIALDAQIAVLTHYHALQERFAQLATTGDAGLAQAELIPLRNELEAAIGLDEFYALEEATVEHLS
jgi:methylisocitrate lyase